MDVGFDLLLVERLPGPAEELCPDFLGRDRDVAFDAQFRDGPFGKPVPLLSPAPRHQDSGRIENKEYQRNQRNPHPDPSRTSRRTVTR